MTFLQKSYRTYSKVENPVLVTTSCEGLDDEEKLEMVSVVSQSNNNYNAVSDSKSENNDTEAEGNDVDDDIYEEVVAMPKTTINTKVVQARKKLQASYSNNTNKIVKQATQKKCKQKFKLFNWSGYGVK